MIDEDIIIENLINRLMQNDCMEDIPYVYENRIYNGTDNPDMKVKFTRYILSQVDGSNGQYKSIFYLNTFVDVKIGMGTGLQNSLIVEVRSEFDPQLVKNINMNIDSTVVNINTIETFTEGTTVDGYYRRNVQIKITATKMVA